MARKKGYNPFKAAGFKNLRQVLGKVGKSNIARAAGGKIIDSIKGGGGGGGSLEEGYRRGGLVKKTGKTKVHRGELIIPARMVRQLGLKSKR